MPISYKKALEKLDCEFGDDFLIEEFTEQAAETVGCSVPYRLLDGPADRLLEGRARAGARISARLAKGEPPLKRDLDRIPGAVLLRLADQLEGIVLLPRGSAALRSVIESLRQSAVMLAQDWLARNGYI